MHTTTIWQPWASLIAIGAKPFETRNYPPPAKLIGQRIAIHAAVRDPSPMLNDMDRATIDAIVEALEDGGLGRRVCWAALPRGAVVATAVLAGAYQVIRVIDQQGDSLELARTADKCTASPPPPHGGAIPADLFGDYSSGRWCWHLIDVQRLPEPIPAKGKQGWWFWEPPAREAA